MAYTHTQYEVIVGKDLSLASTADVADWACGMVPHRIRAVGVVITNTVGSAGIVKLDKRPTAGSDTSRGDGDVCTINLATTHDAGEVVYKTGLNVEILPGQEVVAEVTDACASGDTAHVVMLVEPRWDQPANNTKMIETA
jgi:hypothetical protein